MEHFQIAPKIKKTQFIRFLVLSLYYKSSIGLNPYQISKKCLFFSFGELIRGRAMGKITVEMKTRSFGTPLYSLNHPIENIASKSFVIVFRIFCVHLDTMYFSTFRNDVKNLMLLNELLT